MASILRPINGVREKMRAQGLQPKDHQREYVQQIKEIQKANRMKSDREKSNRQEPFKMSRFKSVSSKLRETLESPPASTDDNSSDNGKTHFLKARSMEERMDRRRTQLRKKIAEDRQRDQNEHGSSIQLTKLPSVPKRGECVHVAQRTERNFVQENRKEVENMQRTTDKTSDKTQSSVRTHKHSSFGKVPE